MSRRTAAARLSKPSGPANSAPPSDVAPHGSAGTRRPSFAGPLSRRRRECRSRRRRLGPETRRPATDEQGLTARRLDIEIVAGRPLMGAAQDAPALAFLAPAPARGPHGFPGPASCLGGAQREVGRELLARRRDRALRHRCNSDPTTAAAAAAAAAAATDPPAASARGVCVARGQPTPPLPHPLSAPVLARSTPRPGYQNSQGTAAVRPTRGAPSSSAPRHADHADRPGRTGL